MPLPMAHARVARPGVALVTSSRARGRLSRARATPRVFAPRSQRRRAARVGASADDRDGDAVGPIEDADDVLRALDSVLGVSAAEVAADAAREREEEEAAAEDKRRRLEAAAAADAKKKRAEDVADEPSADDDDDDDDDDDADADPPPWLWWSDRALYDVPTVFPTAALTFLALHLVVFVGDYALYAAGVGNGGDLFLRVAEVDDAVITYSQWWRPFTSCLADYGLVHFAVANLGLIVIGLEANAVLGTWPFVAIYVLSGAVGSLVTTATDADTNLTVGGGDALLGVVGAMCVYILINVEPDWNRAGCYTRCITMGVVATALLWLGGMPTIGSEHVVRRVFSRYTGSRTIAFAL